MNAIIRYIQGDFTEIEYNDWKDLFTEIPEKLTQEDGAQYFMKTFKAEFIRDAPRVFMWRLLGFFRTRRGREDIVTWLTKYNLTFDRL